MTSGSISPRIRKALAGGITALALMAAVGGAANAQTPTTKPGGTPPANVQQRSQEHLNSLASKLGKTPADLLAAFKAVKKEGVAKAVTEGKLTAAQAAEINTRIDQETGIGGFGGLGGRGGAGGPGMGGPRGGMEHRGGPGGIGGPNSAALTQFLGIQDTALKTALQSGKSLAQVAQDNGKTRDALKTFLSTQAKTRIDAAVAAGKLTQDQATKMLANQSTHLDQMIDRTGAPGGRGGHGGKGGPGGGRGPGGNAPAGARA